MAQGPPIANAPLPNRLVRPLERFLTTEALGGVLLLATATVALVWANLPGDSYENFWTTPIGIDIGSRSFELELVDWVNDGLMTIFFFVVGMEIKREVLRGELADRRRAALPVAAALGGMIAPAILYLSLNLGTDGEAGWGIPMATDIAFSLGVLALLGQRVPVSLKVFLLALAITDDLGAIAVIAIFYTDDLSLAWLGIAGALMFLAWTVNKAGIRDILVYVAIGVVAWFAVHESGVHATVAGVAFGLLAPITPVFSRDRFTASARHLVGAVEESEGRGSDGDEQRSVALQNLEELSRESQSMLDRLVHALHPWTSFIIVPIFALANAGVQLGADAIGDSATSRVGLGIAVGLAVGKPFGIMLLSWVAVRSGIAVLPDGAEWSHIFGVGLIAGIGFTVSIFIADLAFTDPALIAEAKIAILGTSVFMAAVGLAYLYLLANQDSAAREQVKQNG